MYKKTIIAFTTFLLALAFNFSTKAKGPSHEMWDRLLKKHVTADGKVDYKGFIKDSVEFNKYLKLLSENSPDEKTWSSNEQKAFWINAYNAFTVKLITRYYPIKSIKDIGSKIQIPFVNTPWDVKFIEIGNEKMDLNNIEHGKLRNQFNDPRIHFAIVCASKSCPVLLNEAYDAARIDMQLDTQARAFLKDTTRNKITADKPEISKIFEWYKKDFTKKESLIDFLNHYAPVKIKQDAKIDHIHYNWDLNE
ncbi:MAG: DUF547 domain-containing protein [Bacteroidetes bacterium]|nr:DUF547 domain-containing protein [Bacteroidota bacterium]